MIIPIIIILKIEDIVSKFSIIQNEEDVIHLISIAVITAGMLQFFVIYRLIKDLELLNLQLLPQQEIYYLC